LLPLAFDDEIVGELLIVDYEEIALPDRFVNRRSYRYSLEILATADGLAVFKRNGLIVPELSVAVVLEILLDEILKLVPRLVCFSARRSFG